MNLTVFFANLISRKYWCIKLIFLCVIGWEYLAMDSSYLLFRNKHYRGKGPDLSWNVLIAAAHCHVSCFACQHNVKVWALFPWMGVSWDEVCLMCDLSWAARRDCCQHLQWDGHQRGSDVPLDATWHQGGTSVPGSGRVHFWGLLLQFVPLGNLWAGAKTAGYIPNPSLPAG